MTVATSNPQTQMPVEQAPTTTLTQDTPQQPQEGAQQQTQQPTQKTPLEFRQLLERDKQLRQAAAALKEKERVLAEAEELVTLAKKDPFAFLEKQGTTYDEWTKRILKGDRGDPNALIKSEVQQLKEELEKERQAREEAYLRQQEEADRRYVQQFVEAGDYPLIKAAGAQSLVYDQIQTHYNRTGQVISEAEAAEAVEGYLMGLVEALVKVDKVKQRLAGSQPEQDRQPVSSAQPGMTLSNQHQATVASRLDTGSQLLPFEESIARAAKMLRFKETE